MRAVATAPSSDLDQVRLRALIDEYFAALRVAGRSPRTIEWYRDNLLEFVQFAERDGHPAKAGDLQALVVRRWLLSLQSRPRRLAPSSIAGRVRSLKAFGTWVAGEFDLASNPLRGVPLPRIPEQLVPSLATLKSSPCSAPSRDPAIRSATGRSSCSSWTQVFGLARPQPFALVTWTELRVGVAYSGRVAESDSFLLVVELARLSACG
jgi:hypothetical protein